MAKLLYFALFEKIAGFLVFSIALLLFIACSKPQSNTLETPYSTQNSCQTNADCVLAIQVDECCSCPEVTTLMHVHETKGLEIYIPGQNYGEQRPLICAQVDCFACQSPPAGAICSQHVCQAPQTVQEVLNICSDCYLQASQAAYIAGDKVQAIEFCQKSDSADQILCFSELLDLFITDKDYSNAELICRNNYYDLGECLLRIAKNLAILNQNEAIRVCKNIRELDIRHFSCIVEVALVVKEQNVEQALKICDLLGTNEVSLCYQDVLK